MVIKRFCKVHQSRTHSREADPSHGGLMCIPKQVNLGALLDFVFEPPLCCDERTFFLIFSEF